MLSYVGSLARHPVRWLVFMLLFCGGSAWVASKLQLQADLLSMLPRDVRAAEAYGTLLEEFGGLERIFVVVTDDAAPPTGERSGSNFVLDATLLLEERLSKEPLIARVRAGLEPEDESFLFSYVVPREVLRDSTWTRDRIAVQLEPDAIARRVRLLRDKIRNPVDEFSVRSARFDPLGFAEGNLAGRSSELGLSVDPLSGLFHSRRGSALLMLEPVASELDSAAGRQLADALDRIFTEVNAVVGGSVDISAAGGPLYAAVDEQLIRTDLEWTISLSITGCLLVLLLAFGSWRATAVAIAVLAGAFATSFGALSLLRGDMLAVSLGFAAVLVGLGIDYVIHAVTRFRQGLDDGLSGEAALIEVVRDSGAPLLASALTTAAGFAVLLFSAMRPLMEIGLLVSFGILAMLVCTLLIGGPLMVLLMRPTKSHKQGAGLALLWSPSGRVPAALSGLAKRRPRAVLVVTLACVLISLWSARTLRFEPRFEDLRPDDHPLERTERLLTGEFGLAEDAATILVRGTSVDQALDRSRAVAAHLLAAAASEQGTLAGTTLKVSSPSDLILSGSELERRVTELEDLPWEAAASELERLLPLSGLNPQGFAEGIEALRDLGEGREPQAGTALAWPDWITSQISTDDNGATVAIRIRTDAVGSQALSLDSVATELEALVDEPNAVRVASAFALGEQLRVVGERETKGLAAASLAVVFLVVALSLRFSPMSTILALLPIGVGATLAFGVLGLTAGRLDFLSLAIVPMLFGIGIDDGLHALCGGAIGRGRGRHGSTEPRGDKRRKILLRDMLQRIDHASRAITLTTVTTAVGFGSLVASAMPGLRTGGVIVAVGVVVCWLTTVMVLPAIAALLLRRGESASIDAPGGATAAPSRSQPGTHAPEVSQRWRRSLGALHFSSPHWYRLHAWILRVLPSWAVSLIMWPVLLVFYVLLGNVRRALVTNQRAASGPSQVGFFEGHWHALLTLYNFAWCFSETYEGLFDPATRGVSTVSGVDHWLAVTGENQGSDESSVAAHEPSEAKTGFIIVTAHVGHWEVGSHLSKFERPRKVHVVREPEMNPGAQAFLEDLFSRGGTEYYQVHFARTDDPMLGGRLLSALRRGEIVALQGDRPRAGGKTVRVELLGRDYQLPIGPFAMARAARVPILPVFVFRDGRRRSALHLRAPIDVPRTQSRQQDFVDAAQEFARQVEWAISERPRQWFCLRKLWDA